MTTPVTPTIRYLPFAGTLPFVGCAVLLWLGMGSLPVLINMGTVSDVLSGYTLVIASFMAGSTWGSQLPRMHGQRLSTAVAVLTNVVALALWVGFLILAAPAFWLLSALAFVVILLLDWLLLKQGVIAVSYFKIRAMVTTVVVLALFGAVVALL